MGAFWQKNTGRHIVMHLSNRKDSSPQNFSI